MKRLDDFFASEDIKPSVRYPSPTETDETINVVSFQFRILSYLLCLTYFNLNYRTMLHLNGRKKTQIKIQATILALGNSILKLEKES